MEIILLTVHIILALAIIAAVLLQPADASMGFGSNSPLSGVATGKSTLNFAAKLTAWLTAAFICTSLLLGIMATRANKAQSILDQATVTPSVAEKTIQNKVGKISDTPTAPKAPKVPVTP
jgi:preprotein translocase subunit SecG